MLGIGCPISIFGGAKLGEVFRWQDWSEGWEAVIGCYLSRFDECGWNVVGQRGSMKGYKDVGLFGWCLFRC